MVLAKSTGSLLEERYRMGKAVISNRIYMDLPENKKELFDTLTYNIIKNPGKGRFETLEVIRNYRMVTPKIISIPQGRLDLVPEGYEIIDKRVEIWEDFPDPRYNMYPEQAIIHDQVDDSCIINALVGWGKSSTALNIFAKLGQKTLVVVHNTSLRDQWVAEVEKLYGFTPGTIGAGQYDISTPIVIGNVQSVTKKIQELSKEFGTIALDECHHCPATTFSAVLDSSHARYRIGLSGTIKRKDGKEIIFRDYFGPTVFKPPQSNTMDPTIHTIKTDIKIPPGSTWAHRITTLLSDISYIEFIASLALVQANKGHKVLVIADRVQFLNKVSDLIGQRAVSIVGNTDDRAAEIDKIESGKADILCGSRQIFSEGISINCLSCVILATPIANNPTLEQIIGRIMRLSPNKLPPVVIDLHFAGVGIKAQNSQRINLYIEKGWKIVSF